MSLTDDERNPMMSHKLDEAEGRGYSLAEMDAMTDRLKRPRSRKPLPVTEQDRLDWEERKLLESEEAEGARHRHRMAQAAAERGDVWWPGKPGIDRRVFDVSGHASVRGR